MRRLRHTGQRMEMSTPLETQACADRDFVEWHGGCPWCAVWVVRGDGSQLEPLVDQARAAIALWLLPRYARQPHVTVAYRGLMAGQAPHSHAVFGQPQLQRDLQALQAAGLAPFALTAQGVGSFSTVPYLAVSHPPALQQAHQVLAGPSPDPDWRYVPHVTLGHYARQLPLQVVMAQLQASGVQHAVHQLPVEALWLARYRTDDIAGALYFEGRFDLRTQSYVAEPGALIELFAV